MKKTCLTLALISFIPLVARPAAFTAGDLLVVRVGDGTTALGNTQGPLSILELNSSGGLVQPALGIASGSGGLQILVDCDPLAARAA